MLTVWFHNPSMLYQKAFSDPDEQMRVQSTYEETQGQI